MTKSEQNIQVIKDMYAAFGRGDLPAIFERIAERGFERWEMASHSRQRAPWHLSIKQKSEVAAYFEAVLGTMEPLRFEPSAFAASDSHVYATTDHEYRIRKTGRTLVMRDVMHRFKLVDGLVVEVIINEDTALTAETLG